MCLYIAQSQTTVGVVTLGDRDRLSRTSWFFSTPAGSLGLLRQPRLGGGDGSRGRRGSNRSAPRGDATSEAERSRSLATFADARSHDGKRGAGRLRGSVGDGGWSPDHPSWSPNQFWAPFIVFSTLKIRQLRCKKNNLHKHY